MTGGGPTRVGVLSLHESKETKAILNAAEALGADIAWMDESNTAIRIRDDGRAIEPDVDIVVNRLLLSRADHPTEALCLADAIAEFRPVLNRPEAVLAGLHKLTTAAALASVGIHVPEALFALDADRLNAEHEAFGSPAVYKTAIGTHGGGTWLVDLDEPVSPTVGNRWAFLQEFVDVGGDRNRDLRVYVVGGEVVGAMHRYAAEGEWRTNVALGGEVEDATDEVGQAGPIAREATAALGLDYAGVDLIKGEDGWYVLEVNPTAGFRGLFDATGVSPAPYIAALAIEHAGGTVEGTLVEELAAEFDDSDPSCLPPAAEPPDIPPVIGYTQEILVTGTTGSETVLAKSDTGASRTSIDTELAAAIGAGPIRDRVRIKSGSLKAARSRPLVDVVIDVNGDRHTVTASIEDRSHMDYPILLGRDILNRYYVDVRRRDDDQKAN